MSQSLEDTLADHEKRFFRVVGVIVAIVVVGFGFLIWEVQTSNETSCQAICRTRHTEMQQVTNYGCLCQDGQVIQYHGSCR